MDASNEKTDTKYSWCHPLSHWKKSNCNTWRSTHRGKWIYTFCNKICRFKILWLFSQKLDLNKSTTLPHRINHCFSSGKVVNWSRDLKLRANIVRIASPQDGVTVTVTTDILPVWSRWRGRRRPLLPVPKATPPNPEVPPLGHLASTSHEHPNELYEIRSKHIKNINKIVTYIFSVQLSSNYFWECGTCWSCEPKLKPQAKVASWSHRLFTSEHYLVGVGPFNPSPAPCLHPVPPPSRRAAMKEYFDVFRQEKKNMLVKSVTASKSER